MKRCNWCFVQELEKRAREEGKKLIFKPSDNLMGGTNILFIPEDNIQLPFYGQETEEEMKRKFFFCWLFQIPEVCTC